METHFSIFIKSYPLYLCIFIIHVVCYVLFIFVEESDAEAFSGAKERRQKPLVALGAHDEVCRRQGHSSMRLKVV